jgi:hypothetical protein
MSTIPTFIMKYFSVGKACPRQYLLTQQPARATATSAVHVTLPLYQEGTQLPMGTHNKRLLGDGKSACCSDVTQGRPVEAATIDESKQNDQQ